MTAALQVDLSCDAASSETVLQFRQETPAEARMRRAKQRQLLRDEAQGWRIVAETAARAPAPSYRINIVVPVLEATGWDYDLIARQEARVQTHTGAMRGKPAFKEYSAETMGLCVLFALLLALECEDELKALTPKKRSRRPSQKRRGAQ